MSSDSNIVVRGKFILPKSESRSWYESTLFSNYNGSKKTSYKSDAHYKARKTEAILEVEEPLGNKKIKNPKGYADYAARKTTATVSNEIKIISKGHITRDGIIQNKDLNNWKIKNSIHKKSPIWDYVISFKEDYYKKNKIFFMEDAQRLLDKTFDRFIQRNYMDPKAITYRANWHVDKAHHFHMHISFWQKRASKTNYRTGKEYVNTRGNLRESSFEFWKNMIDTRLQQEKKLFQYYNISRDNVKHHVVGQFNDNEKVSLILEDAKWIKARVPKGRFQYNAIKDVLVKKKIDGVFDKLIKNDKKTLKSYLGARTLIEEKIIKEKSRLDNKKNSRTINNLNKIKTLKINELDYHLKNQILKRIKNIDSYDTRVNKYKLKQVAIKNKINQNNKFIKSSYSGKKSISIFINTLTKNAEEEIDQMVKLFKKLEYEKELNEWKEMYEK